MAPPMVPEGILRRGRLDDALTRGANGAVTLVCAGPGSGKTSAVASWLSRLAVPVPVAWLTVHAVDNDLRAFWSDVLACLAHAGALPVGSMLSELVPGADFGAAEVLRIRVGLAELPGPVLLV